MDRQCLFDSFGDYLCNENITKRFISPSHTFLDVKLELKPLLVNFITHKEEEKKLHVIYFGLFDGAAFIKPTVILLARGVSLYDGVSMCQSAEPKLIEFHHPNEEMKTLVSSRYSVALTMKMSQFDVHIFIVEVREGEAMKEYPNEKYKVMTDIVGK